VHIFFLLFSLYCDRFHIFFIFEYNFFCSIPRSLDTEHGHPSHSDGN
jgi:hypothetical protein